MWVTCAAARSRTRLILYYRSVHCTCARSMPRKASRSPADARRANSLGSVTARASSSSSRDKEESADRTVIVLCVLFCVLETPQSILSTLARQINIEFSSLTVAVCRAHIATRTRLLSSRCVTRSRNVHMLDCTVRYCMASMWLTRRFGCCRSSTWCCSSTRPPIWPSTPS